MQYYIDSVSHEIYCLPIDCDKSFHDDRIAAGCEACPPRPSPLHQWLNGAWILDPAVEAQALVDNKAAALVELTHLHADYLAKKTGNPTAPEMASWDFKLTLANTIKSGGIVDAVSAQFLTNAGIIDTAAWAESVLVNAAAYKTILGRSELLRATHKTAIRAAQTQVELDAAMTDIRIGWAELAKQP